MKRLLSLVPLILGGVLVFAQSARDSLLRIWQDPEVADSFRMEAFHKLIVDHYVFPYPDSAIDMANALLIFAENSDNHHFIGEAYNVKAWAHLNKMETNQALEYNKIGLKIAEKYRDSIVMSKCLNDLGISYLNMGKVTEAYKSFNRSLKISEALDLKMYVVHCYGNIGNIFSQMGDWKMAEKYYLRQIELNEEIQDEQNGVTSRGNLGYGIFEFGRLCKGRTILLRSNFISRRRGIQIGLRDRKLEYGGIFIGEERLGHCTDLCR